MKRVRITLDPHEDAIPPIYDRLTRGSALERVRIENWNVREPPATFLLWLRGDYEGFAEALETDDAVADSAVFSITDETCHCFLTGEVGPAARALFENFTRGSLLTVPPVECHDDGSSTFTVVGADSDVQAAVDGVPQDSTVTVERVGDTRVAPDGVVGGLSARQREALAVGVAVGYYDRPRGGTCADVAAELGCATATAAEHLRKAETKLVRAALDEIGSDE